MTRHWSINGRFLGQPVTGVQRYAEGIVRALDQHLAERHPLVRDLSVELLLPEGSTRELGLQHIATRRVPGGSGQVWEQLALARAVRGGLVSLCNTGPLRISRQIVCIHDVNTRLCPQSYSWQFRALYRLLVPALARRAARVTTVSQFSRAQIAGFGICGPDKVAVIPNGSEHALAWTPCHSRASAQAASPRTVVLLGSQAPHKNIGIILGLAPRLAALGVRIAVVGGGNGKVFSGVEAAGSTASPGVIWLGRLADAELAALLRDSLCLAFPSLTEGFGLPPLEAMAIGVPVVSSDRASLPEICAHAALYASPEDPDAWFERITRLLNDAELRRRLQQAGPLQARHFSWRRSAERYLELMAEVDGVALVPGQAAAIGPQVGR